MSTSIQWLTKCLTKWLTNQLRKQRRQFVFLSIVMVCSLMAGLFHSKFRHFVHPRECAVPGISDFRLRWLKPPKLVA